MEHTSFFGDLCEELIQDLPSDDFCPLLSLLTSPPLEVRDRDSAVPCDRLTGQSDKRHISTVNNDRSCEEKKDDVTSKGDRFYEQLLSSFSDPTQTIVIPTLGNPLLFSVTDEAR